MMNIIKTNHYQWNQNWSDRFAHTDINPVIEELSIIEEINGQITPPLIVESAKNKKSSLHAYFTWDNKIAGDRYRNSQAAKLIRNIEVSVVKEEKIIHINAFVKSTKINPYDDGEYKTIILSDANSMHALIKMSADDLKKCIRRLQVYEQLQPALDYIELSLEFLENVSQPKELSK